ncbi:hypothetical protein L208DRAFT_1383176 [Tricholoma matsutake]|nr:hypothetical protein L208DRAFT_1383176 [Tricholoma matsutake 945]
MNAASEKGISLTLNVEQWENMTGGNSGENPPPRQVLSTASKIIQPLCDKNIENIDWPSITKDEREMEVTISAQTMKSMIEEGVNMHSNDSGGEEQPPSREVVINLEMDC